MCLPTFRKIRNSLTNTICKQCFRYEEDISHVFWDCPTANTVFSYFSPILTTILDEPLPDFAGTLIPLFLLDIPKRNLYLTVFIIKIINFHLWLHRNEVVHENKQISTVKIINKIKSELKSITKLHFKNKMANNFDGLADFSETFCIKNAFCYILNGKPFFNL